MSKPTAFSAVRWTLAGNILQRAAGFVGLGLITRILATEIEGKEIFGAFQALVSFHLVAMAFLPMGFDLLVVREKASAEFARYVRALRGSSVLLFAALAVCVLAAAPLWARALELESRAQLIWYVPLILLIQALRWGIKPLLASEMAFRRISSGEFLNTSVTMIGGAGLLYFWRESGALYAAFALGELTETIWLWRGRDVASVARVRENTSEFFALARRHKRFCAVLGIDQGVNAFSNNSPALLLGGLIGQDAVGLYGMASRLMTSPINLLIGAVGKITLPAFAGRAEEELQHRLLLTLRLAAAVIPAVLLWVVFFAPVVVTVVLGSRWTGEATPLLQWLALNLLFQSLFSPISVIDVIRDRPEVTLGWNLANLAARSGALVFAAAKGMSVIGAIAVYSAVSAVMWLVYGCLLAWLLRGGFLRFVGSWMRYVPLWLALAGGLWALRQLIDGQPVLAVFLSALPLAVYAALVWLFDREAAQALLRVAGSRIGSGAGSDDKR